MLTRTKRVCLAVALVSVWLVAPVFAAKDTESFESLSEIPAFSLPALGHAFLCMLVASSLAAVLAMRPRRAGGPPAVPHVIQTQIMLSIVGALVMLIVGASLARAFGIAGAAGLVRYRAKVDDPKDASVMLSCLALGLASGVGLFFIAAAGAAFILVVLWILEWREPWPGKLFELKITSKQPAAFKAPLEAVLRHYHVKYELRAATDSDISYAVDVPQNKRTDRISESIMKLGGAESVSVAWAERKAAK